MDPRWYHRAQTAIRHKRQQIAALTAHMQTLPAGRKVGFKDCLIEVLRDEFDDDGLARPSSTGRTRCTTREAR